MPTYDLLIVGAGPGGSNCAAVALRGGLSVAQLDAARFPRVKPCAGGMTVKAAHALQLALEPSLRRSFRAVEFNLWKRRVTRFEERDVLLTMVCRPDFDNDLVCQNRRHAGLTFLDGHKVTGLRFDGTYEVVTDQGTFRARQLVGADGAYSLVNRVFGISRIRGQATAVEINVRTGEVVDPPDHVPSLDYGVVSRGYGWVFPKDDHWSIGIYTVAPKTSGFRPRLLEYARSKRLRLDPAAVTRMEAHRVPIGGFTPTAASHPVYIVGDAGGFADALTGEGIYYALESGRLAGEVAVAVHEGRATHREYYRRLRTRVIADTALSYLLARVWYADLDLGMRLLESPLLWRPLIHGHVSAATFAETAVKHTAYLARSLRRGARKHRSAWS